MKKKKGYLAPVLVVAFIVLYYIGIAVVFLLVPGIPGWAKVLLCLIPLAVCALAIHVLVQRIREIKNGEEDDLEQY
ncbi:MAG: hypothetical protein E7446_00275 [Ruminococcaceae bacterium]|nr:hypothetical protein [Oscillospiraceae bacterium]